MKQEKIKKLDKLRRNIIISEIIFMIVFMIPIFIGGYIQCKRSDWETDRNFLGDEFLAQRGNDCGYWFKYI